MCVRCHHLVTRDVIKPLYSDRQSVTTALKQTQKEIRQKCTASYLQSFIFPVPFIYSLLIRHVLLLHRQRFVTLGKLSDTGKPLRFRGNMTSCCVFFFFWEGGGRQAHHLLSLVIFCSQIQGCQIARENVLTANFKREHLKNQA